MKISILAATLGIATLAATPLFAQSQTQNPASGQTPAETQSPGMNPGASMSGTMSHHRGMSSSHGRSSRSAGLSSTTVKQVQQKLEQSGINVGPVDGKMGPKTRTAVKEFQQKKGIQANGRLNHQTLAALGVQTRHRRSGSSSGSTGMSPGSSSDMNSGSSSGMSSGGSSGGMGNPAMPK